MLSYARSRLKWPTYLIYTAFYGHDMATSYPFVCYAFYSSNGFGNHYEDFDVVISPALYHYPLRNIL